MAYIGQSPFQEFTNPPTKDSFTGDGSTVAFDLAAEVPSGSQNALEVYVDNVRQEPGTGKAFTLSVDGSGDTKRITFTAAPANGASIYVINDKTNASLVAPLQNDLNGTELILDADADTSIHAESDDIIDLKIAGADVLKFIQSSGDAIIKVATDAKDLIFQQADGNKLFEINDGNFVGVGGNATAPGEIRIFEDTDLGTNYSGFTVGNLTASVAYQLPNADGSSGQQLTTDGSGVLSWVAAGATVANNTNNRVLTATGGTTLNGEANLTFDGSTLALTGAFTASTTIQATTITATTAFVPDASDGAALGTSALEFSDLFLADGAVINFGDDQDVSLTHVADTGLQLSSTDKLMFNDASQFIHAPSATVLDIAATDEIELTATLIDVVGNFTNSGTIISAGIVTAAGFTIGSAVIGEAELEILDGATVTTGELNLIDGDTSRGTTAVASGDGILINDAGTMRMTNVDTVSTYFASHTVGGGNIVTTGALGSGSIAAGFGAIDNGTSGIRTNTFTAETAFVPDASGGADLGTTSLEFNDAFFNDGAVINFGDDQDVKLTHTADTGLTLNSTMKLMFNDASQFIQGTSATVLSIAATDEIDLTATAVDLNGTLNVSGVATFQATPVFPDGSLAVADLDIDGATDIGAAIVDADLFIVDDGAGGANRKTTAARIKTYATTGAITTITSLLATDIKIGEDDQTKIDFETADEIHLYAANAEQVFVSDGVFGPQTDSDVDLGTTGVRFKDAFIDTITTTGNITAAGVIVGSTVEPVGDTSAGDNAAIGFTAGEGLILTGQGSTYDVVIKNDADALVLGVLTGTTNINVIGTVTSTGFTIGSAVIAEAELELLDGITAGTTAASKVFTSDSNNLTAISGAVVMTEDTLSFDATQDWDVRASPVAKVTLTANVTFDAPSNPTTGQYISIVCIQDGTGSRTIAWNAVFEFKDDETPTATTTAAKGDMFTFRYNGAKWLEVGRNFNLTLS